KAMKHLGDYEDGVPICLKGRAFKRTYQSCQEEDGIIWNKLCLIPNRKGYYAPNLLITPGPQ
ncbi:MAG: hypothetical protein ACOCUH_01600, partial [Bacteriovoracia bacterium]